MFEEDKIDPYYSERSKQPAKKKKHSGARATWPADFVLTPQRLAYAMERLACHEAEARGMWEHFEAHHTATGSLFVDWGKAWVTWVSREVQTRARAQRIYNPRKDRETLKERVARAGARFKS